MTVGFTIPLRCLLALVLWTIVLVAALTAARFRHLGAGGSHRDFAIPDDRRLIWRLFRAHANAVENLPLFASAVLAAAVMGRTSSILDVLAVVYLVARVGQSIVHVAPGAGIRFHVRFGFFVAQMASLAAFVVVLVTVR
jgi:uncharacterized MAPEG superfamily protein